jgi:hypothetical protein
MSRSAFAAVLAAALSISPAASAVQLHELPLRFVTADGAWDCRDEAGAGVGTLVIADKTYAFIDPDGILAGYGRLHRVGIDDYDLPHYVVLDGYMKEALQAQGTTMRGPRGDTEHFARGIFFVVVLANSDEIECARREAPDA